MCVRFSLQILVTTFLIPEITERDIINVYWSSCEVVVFLVRFSGNLSFLYKF